MEVVRLEMSEEDRKAFHEIIEEYCNTHTKGEITRRSRLVQDTINYSPTPIKYILLSADEAYALNRCLLYAKTTPKSRESFIDAMRLYNQVANAFARSGVDFFKYIEKYSGTQ